MTIRLPRDGDKRAEMVISKLLLLKTWQLAQTQSKLRLTVLMEKHIPHLLFLKLAKVIPSKVVELPVLETCCFSARNPGCRSAPPPFPKSASRIPPSAFPSSHRMILI